MERSSGPRKTSFNLSESTHHQLQACTRWRQAQLGVGVVAILLVLFAISAQAQTSITIGYFRYDGDFWQTYQGQSYQENDYEFELDTKGITEKVITFHDVILYAKGGSLGTYPTFPHITTGLGCGNPPYQTPCDILFTPYSPKYDDLLCGTTKDQGVTWKQSCISIALQLVAPGGKDFTFKLVDGTKFCASGITNIFLEAQPDNRILDPRCSPAGCYGISTPIILKSTCK
jgi:hypothetical protein